jgi:hypothetical protein
MCADLRHVSCYRVLICAMHGAAARWTQSLGRTLALASPAYLAAYSIGRRVEAIAYTLCRVRPLDPPSAATRAPSMCRARVHLLPPYMPYTLRARAVLVHCAEAERC